MDDRAVSLVRHHRLESSCWRHRAPSMVLLTAALPLALFLVAAAWAGTPHADEGPVDTHWAFQPVNKPAVPAIDDEWVRSPIDAFVLQRLRQEGMSPSPRADRRTLLRRATFDLTGLPPAYEALQQFQQDEAPGAFARVVDELLASPTYGQHWARHWLDVARYADTKGYVFTANPYYPYAYTYRDYVIEAFNDDVPYDRFVVEQLAADLVETPRNDRTLAALGFLTVGRRFNNNRHDILDDRIDAITRGFLGLTVACARCHDHKYDPIPTRDYYSLYGVLASCEEPDDLPYVGDPQEHPGYETFMSKLEEKQQEAEDYLSLQHALLAAELRSGIEEYLHAAALRRAGAPAEETPGHLKPRILERWQEFLASPVRAKDPAFSVWAALDKLPENGFADAALEKLHELGQRAVQQGDRHINLLVVATLLQKRPQSQAEAALALGRLFAAADSPWVSLDVPLLSASQISPAVFRQVEELLASHTTAGAAEQAGSLRPILRVSEDLKSLREFLYSSDAPMSLTPRQARRSFDVRESQELRRLEREVEEFEAKSPHAPPRAMVVVDRSSPVEPRVFERGNPDRPGEQVPRQFLAAITDGRRQPFQHGSGRLELAGKIASFSNPLTARVIVNRVWQHHFGEGLVRSPSNFGAIGERPTHPQLLDWLASEFIEHGWSLKWLHREIMRSSTYQQISEFGVRTSELEEGPLPHSAPRTPRSALTPLRTRHSEFRTRIAPNSELRTPHSTDPENRLLGRQNRRRLDFEPMRDSLLAWAGRLDLTHGGQPFKLGEQPSIPRRTIYGLIDRQHLYDPLRYFDVASPDASAAERPRTTVPQQALFLLNSPFVAEQARALVERLDVASARSPSKAVTAMYETVLLRKPTNDELARAEAFLAGGEGEAARPSDSHLSRMEKLAQTLMVCNEAVFVD